ncbi:MAG: 16S rRNA (guanine(527)-N(7))-methyltransferase RsmG [Anaerolineales bacterium]|jgi:16S rRNA (guanine527-N7)-methyltransferase|nr:16S rRNA (guanine(527)-N(7))-methyltransferase RsmG [Anaerolineales bacterium]MCZ2287271.1 16S rRNA (guanine(527)-N(7))-methyltransferase RsmG [Anaerolineales bacterium]MCZ7547887.1 16S rRNA (guanine(527)-N(7))-methyltransferase RsmG [Anaerolineales bacterium]MDX9937032.1 16S rRNA (guanine(527)-N(7))-methyltransferase RsmG [Anaerolineales bacterium]GER78740.1 16S rRNA (guanine(527)-N(7))-methyltransferase RsmG [Candidatus Denitrolinea symbiosum]
MEKLIHDARELFNVHLTGRQVLALAAYEKELALWNQKFNLTAIRDAEGIRVKHFLDSFSCVLAWKANPPARLVDVGTGAGFPGIPLKILYPSMQVTLVESVGKKAMFCQHVIELLKLDGIEVINARAETLGQDADHREKYDWAVARAVAKLNVLGEYLLPLVKVGGTMLAQKGESGPAEAQSAEGAVKLLGGKLQQVIPLNLPGVAEDRYLVVIRKVHVTPPKYPRKAGHPAKEPL